MEVIFICTGNICRSPMAEYLLRDKVAKAGLADFISVSSAGVMPMLHWQASEYARSVMAERGIDMEAHRASALTAKRAGSAGLLLTMTQTHKRQLKKVLPESLWPKLYTLAEYAQRGGDVADPYGGELCLYRQIADEIEGYIDSAFARMAALAKAQGTDDEAER